MNQIFTCVFTTRASFACAVLGLSVAIGLSTGNAAAAVGGQHGSNRFAGRSAGTIAHAGQGRVGRGQFSGGRFSGSRFSGSGFSGSRFSRSGFSSRFNGSGFSGSRFSGSRFDHGRFRHDHFEHQHFGSHSSNVVFYTYPSYGYYGYTPSYYSYPDYDYVPEYYDDSSSYTYRYAPAYRERVVEGRATESLATDVQTELARRGYYRAPIDGIIGEGTRRALRNFQNDAGLPVTGRMDRATIGELGLG
jgi:hypothetical protein